MGTLEVFPDAAYSESGSKTLTGGASAVAVLSDASDASYITAAGTTSQSYKAWFRMGPLTGLPAGAIVTGIQLRHRYSHEVKNGWLYECWQPITILVGRQSGTNTTFTGYALGEPLPAFTTTTSPTDITARVQTKTYDGKNWFNDLLLEQGARLFGTVDLSRSQAYNTSRLYSFSLVVTYQQLPTATLTGPTGTVTLSKPTATWTHSDPQGLAQVKYNYRVYTAAMVALIGFTTEDTDTYPPEYDSGDQFSSNPAHSVARSFGGDGSYVGYVRSATSQVVGTTPWSPWSSLAFTLDVTGPVAPAIDAVYDSATNGIIVTVNGRDNQLTWHLSSYEPATPYVPTWNTGSLTTAARSTAQAADGTASLAITRITSTGTAQVSMPAANGTTYGIPATPGVLYQERAFFRAATTGRSCRVGVIYLTAAGTTIGVVAYGSNVTDTTTGWTEATVTSTAPATAVWRRVYLEILSAVATEVHYADKVGGFVGTVTAWNRGGYGDSLRETEIQRSTDSGTTWETVPPSAYSEDTGTQEVVYPDYEATATSTVTYRARVEATNEDGDRIIGDWSANTSETMPDIGYWWLRDLSDPTMSMALHVSEAAGAPTIPGSSDYPLGSASAVASTDGLKAGVLKLKLFLLSRADWDDFWALIDLDRTLFLQDTLGQSWYVRPLGDIPWQRLNAQATATETTPTRHAHEAEVEFLIVERPIERRLLAGT